MGKKSWLQPVHAQAPRPTVFNLYSAVMGARVAVNPAAVHHCDLNGTVKPFTDEELALAASLDVKKTLEKARASRKAAGLPV